jgi:hypothetical protein
MSRISLALIITVIVLVFTQPAPSCSIEDPEGTISALKLSSSGTLPQAVSQNTETFIIECVFSLGAEAGIFRHLFPDLEHFDSLPVSVRDYPPRLDAWRIPLYLSEKRMFRMESGEHPGDEQYFITQKEG